MMGWPCYVTLMNMLRQALAAFFITAFSTLAADRIPVILDTDIGDDIDDTWALALVLKSPEFDLKLAVGDYGNPEYRARLLAKFLQAAGRADVPVGVGVEHKVGGGLRQEAWLKGFDLAAYPGKVHRDGVQAIIDTVMASPEKVTLLCIGPVPNIAAALQREPRLAQRARFVGMHGSVRMGYDGTAKLSAEWNVKAAPSALQAVFAAPWDVTITPLDTCGRVRLKGAKYAAVRDSADPVVRALVENYRIWTEFNAAKSGKPAAVPAESSTLYDTVAVYLALATDLCAMEKVTLRVDDQGFTREDPAGKAVQAALAWKDLPAYEDWLVGRLTGAGK